MNEEVTFGNTEKIPSLYVRTVAYLFDVLLIFVPIFYIHLKTGFFGHGADWKTGFQIAFLFCGFLFVTYQAFSIYLTRKTIGCLLLGLSVVPQSAKKISFLMSWIRAVLVGTIVIFFFPLFLIVHIIDMIVTIKKQKNKYKQAFWDRATKTIVIKSWR
jgi:uncharacterized RDD family membrane protein YckC